MDKLLKKGAISSAVLMGMSFMVVNGYLLFEYLFGENKLVTAIASVGVVVGIFGIVGFIIFMSTDPIIKILKAIDSGWRRGWNLGKKNSSEKWEEIWSDSFEDKISRVIDRQIQSTVESEIDYYDFSYKISEAIDDYDISPLVQDHIDQHDFSQYFPDTENLEEAQRIADRIIEGSEKEKEWIEETEDRIEVNTNTIHNIQENTIPTLLERIKKLEERDLKIIDEEDQASELLALNPKAEDSGSHVVNGAIQKKLYQLLNKYFSKYKGLTDKLSKVHQGDKAVSIFSQNDRDSLYETASGIGASFGAEKFQEEIYGMRVEDFILAFSDYGINQSQLRVVNRIRGSLKERGIEKVGDMKDYYFRLQKFFEINYPNRMNESSDFLSDLIINDSFRRNLWNDKKNLDSPFITPEEANECLSTKNLLADNVWINKDIYPTEIKLNDFVLGFVTDLSLDRTKDLGKGSHNYIAQSFENFEIMLKTFETMESDNG
tara:strand:- start:1734 stop:3200 length:1467 start_codon:yes stop_codon:yes gene_type:complete